MGWGLLIVGYWSLIVLFLLVIMVVVFGLIIVGGVEGIKMKYNEYILIEKNKFLIVGYIICNFNKSI